MRFKAEGKPGSDVVTIRTEVAVDDPRVAREMMALCRRLRLGVVRVMP